MNTRAQVDGVSGLAHRNMYKRTEQYLTEVNLPPLTKKAKGPWETGYAAELDDSRELNFEEAWYYQSQIGVLRWCVELGRIDIITWPGLMQ